ncbi:GSCOCG00012371001-RA-CDS [Cotesia congregata]|nr:GSCOCG00012371001-RA-CDS [Cotesia congregata]
MEMGFKRIMDRFDEEKSERKKHYKEIKTEFSKLEKRNKELEEKVENIERQERKNNLVIFGWDPRVKIEKKEVVEFFQTELEVGKDEEDIDEVRELGSEKKIVWVRMKNWEKKKEVMVNKAKLKGKNIFIEDDRTKTEREEQKKLQRCAWAAKKKEKRIEKRGGVRVLFWNVAGLRSKDKEFWDYVCKFDVIGMTETWVEEKGWEMTRKKLPTG